MSVYEPGVGAELQMLEDRYPQLSRVMPQISQAFDLLSNCFESAHKLLLCGNGGSASDCEHIVGELMKSFVQRRSVSIQEKEALITISSDRGAHLAKHLQPALRAISLTSHTALNTAFANDVDPASIFAQQVFGYGDPQDVLLCISTSGNSENVINAAITAKSLKLKTIGLLGKTGGELQRYCDVSIVVPGHSTAEIQELHLPVYHTLCIMLEKQFFRPGPVKIVNN